MENTVFVRFDPTPQHKVMRHELEDIFSQMGPIKKSSWINTKPENNAATEASSGPSKGYGFIKFLAQEDAENAQKQLNNSKIQMEGNDYTLKVELASLSGASSSKGNKANQREKSNTDAAADGGEDADAAAAAAALLKKKSRIILRNLSFYAKENHIKKIMETEFGKVTDVHLPKVNNKTHVGFCFVTFENPRDAKKAVDSKKVDIQKRSVNMDWSVPKKLHQQQKQEQKQQKEQNQYQQQEQQQKEKKKQDDDDDDDDEAASVKSNSSDEDDIDDNSDSGSDNDDSEEEENDAVDMDEEKDSDDGDDEEEEEKEPVEDDSVGKKCCLFLRNLPFDATRHDLFQLLYKFGHIKGIYLVKDRETNMLKGTAFVTYSKPEGAQRAMEHAATMSDNGGAFVSQRQGGVSRNNNNDDEDDDDNSNQQMRGSLLLKGRKVLVDLAVDKETAATFDSKEYKIPHADRRNLYLQAEARVEGSSEIANADNTDTWDDLPQQDQRKRQTALKDKTAKLQSPIFFINPNRLSFRNMAKHIDEAGLQKLIELATKRGLEKRLVGTQDQIAHWRALGEMSTREILAKVQDIEGKGQDVLPKWSYDDDIVNKNDGASSDGKKKRRINIKDYIPSAFIDRDYGLNGKKVDAQSRGYGFAEFTHHTHALACLRELNNNPAYSRDFTAGGKAADAIKNRPQRKTGKNKGGGATASAGDYRGEDGRVHVPRLVVDFVVENKIKAKKQLERRLHQQLNQSKQMLVKLDKKKDKKGDSESTKRKGRGAIQREKKRVKRESGEEEAEQQKKLQKKAMNEAKKELRLEKAAQKKQKIEELKRKSVKPPKKKKTQLKKVEDDEEFESIVRSYTSKLESTREESTPKTNPRSDVKEKRWFE